MSARLVIYLVLAAASATAQSAAATQSAVIRVGRLIQLPQAGPSGESHVLTDYLESKVPGYAFEFVSFNQLADLMAAVAAARVDFVFVGPATFVELEVKYGVTPLATTVFMPRAGLELQMFGGVVYCRPEAGVRQFSDLRGRRLAATHQNAMALLAVFRELKDMGIRPGKGLASIRYYGSQENVLAAVQRGEMDCGVAASNRFETERHFGNLKSTPLTVLHPPRDYPGLNEYPAAVSTRLYPASAFAKTRRTPMALANKVATALLSLEPGSEPARNLGVGGWSVPLNYQPVHECLQELAISPYENFGKVTISEAVRQHLGSFLLGITLIIAALTFVSARTLMLNRRLRTSQGELREELNQRRLAEQAREKLEDQLRQSQKLESIGRLAGGVAHDFNNLLTVINGYSELLLLGVGGSETRRESLLQIRAAGEKAANLTGQLLAFSRKQTIQPRALDMNTAVREAEKLLRRLLGEDIEIVTVLDPSLELTMADPVQVNQVLLNLAVNARDAMPNGGRFTIETSNAKLDQSHADAIGEMSPGDYVLLAITDTGVGMTEEVRKHLFEPFFTTKERGKGTGLGLSMVYGIVRQNGGSIWVYSEPGQGSTFKIYLPRAAAGAPLEKPAKAAPVDCRGTETVLLVEDQLEVRNLARTALENNGYRVLVAANGAEAMELSKEHREDPIHLLLTDMVMPGMNGHDLAGHLKAVRPEIKVLYMSGYTEKVTTRNGLFEAGAAYIPKPFTPGGLTTKVRETLGPPPAGAG